MAVAYDDENLYVFCDAEIDLTPIPRQPETRDSREIFAVDRLEILIDAAADERQYLQFVATPGGGQLDARYRDDPFAGHFVRKLDWTADWTTETEWRKDGYRMRIVIPFDALGQVPTSGQIWRMNISAYRCAGQPKPQVHAWSTSTGAPRAAESFGTLVFD